MAITGVILNGLMLLGWVLLVGFFLLVVVGIGASSVSTGVAT